MTREELLSILDNPFEQSQPWMIQGLGMLQLKLDDSRTRRLHIWNSRYEIPNHTEIHNHPWDFISEVICGKIYNSVFSEHDFATIKTHEKITIKCGLTECVASTPKNVVLVQTSAQVYKTGQKYFMNKEQPHCTKQAPGTITLIERSNHDPENKADIYYPIGDKWVSAEFRKATNEEVMDIINEAKKYL